MRYYVLESHRVTDGTRRHFIIYSSLSEKLKRDVRTILSRDRYSVTIRYRELTDRERTRTIGMPRMLEECRLGMR